MIITGHGTAPGDLRTPKEEKVQWAGLQQSVQKTAYCGSSLLYLALPQLVLEYPATDRCVKSKKKGDGEKLKKIEMDEKTRKLKHFRPRSWKKKKRVVIRCLDHRLTICTNRKPAEILQRKGLLVLKTESRQVYLMTYLTIENVFVLGSPSMAIVKTGLVFKLVCLSTRWAVAQESHDSCPDFSSVHVQTDQMSLPCFSVAKSCCIAFL